MSNEVNIIVEKLKELPIIHSGRQSIVMLSNSDVNLSVEDFDKAVEYIWNNNLVKILKVEHQYRYIIKFYADVS